MKTYPIPLGAARVILDVEVHGGPACLAQARASAGHTEHEVRWLESPDALSLNTPLIRVTTDVRLPGRWLERLLAAAAEAPADLALSVFCQREGLQPVRSGQYLQASAHELDALCAALAPQRFSPLRGGEAQLPYEAERGCARAVRPSRRPRLRLLG